MSVEDPDDFPAEEIFVGSVYGKNSIKDGDQILNFGKFPMRLFAPSDDKVECGRDGLNEFLDTINKFKRDHTSRLNAIKRDKLSSVFHNLEEYIRTSHGEYYLKLPLYVKDCLQSVKNYPDDNFYGTYNWYYTGGCLQYFFNNENHFLLYVGGKKKNQLCVASLKNDPLWNIDAAKVQKITPCSDQEIFQVTTNNKDIIGIRQKKKCVLYHYKKREIDECFSVDSNYLFVSFAISPEHNELCTIDTKQKLSIWDIHRKEASFFFFANDNHEYDKWHHLCYCADPSTFTITSRKSVKWMDRRTKDPQLSVKLDTFKDTKDDEISIRFNSTLNPNFIYVASNLNVFLIDSRFPEKIMNRWHHRLSSHPLYSCVIPLEEGHEIVGIANHDPGHVNLVYNSVSNTNQLIEVPSRKDSLLSKQFHGVCLDPLIKSRMIPSLTGFTCLPSTAPSKNEILTQSVAGDIFAQNLFNYSYDSSVSGFDSLASSKELLRANKKLNMTELLKFLSVEGENLNENVHTEMPKIKQAWQLSIEELRKYKDTFATIVLDEWGVNIDTQENSQIGSVDKVSAWLNSTCFEYTFSQDKHD